MKDYYNCFVGIPLDYKYIHEAEEIQKKIQKFIPDGSIVEPHNLHLTLYYLGQQTEANLEEISHLIYEGKNLISDDVLEIDGKGIFNREVNHELTPYVVYLRVSKTKKLLDFREHLKAQLDYFNEEERREFTPHITLLRLKTTEAQIQFEKFKTEIGHLLNELEWQFSVREVYIYGKENLNSSKFQDKLYKIPIV